MKNLPDIKDLEKCVRCGSCKAYCPTYDEDNTEAMGARGRLALLRGLLLQELKPTPLLNEKIFSCILCEACSGLCPNGVDITENIYRGRNMLRQGDKRRKYLRLLAKFFVRNPDLSYKMLQMSQYILFPYLLKKGIISSNFKLPGSSLKERTQVYKVQKRRGRVAVFTGCVTNYLYPHLGLSLINILLKSGYEVIVPGGEVCCGMPLRALGLEEEARELAKRNMRIFGKLKAEAVLSLCPTCVSVIKNQYPKIINSGISNAMDVSSFLLERLDFAQPSLFSQKYATVTYHDPCHLAYGLGIKDEPRRMLKKIGANIIEKKENGCCGSGGLFSLTNKDISGSLLKKQAESCLETGAAAVVTACPACMMQLGRAITGMPVFHIIELIEEAYCDSDGV